MMSAVQELAISGGILCGGLLNMAVEGWEDGWRLSYGIVVVFSLIMSVAMLYLPESPRWLMMKGREDEAIASLRVTRYEEEEGGGGGTEAELVRLVLLLQEQQPPSLPSSSSSCATNKKEGSGGGGSTSRWRDLFSSKGMAGYRMMVSFLALTLPLVTGVGHISLFAPLMFSSFTSSTSAILAFVVVAGCEVMTTIATMWFHIMDRFGRRLLLSVGTFFLGVSCTVIALLSTSSFDYEHNKASGLAMIISVSFFVINFAYSWGPLGELI